jgi:hypothetical protein
MMGHHLGCFDPSGGEGILRMHCLVWLSPRSTSETNKQTCVHPPPPPPPPLSLNLSSCPAGFPAAEHRATFELAHKNWLGKTVHAGEAWGPESVFQAITGRLSLSLSLSPFVLGGGWWWGGGGDDDDVLHHNTP